MDSDDGEPLPLGAKGGSVWLRWLVRRVPALVWARGYGRAAAAADLVAGVTLGLTLVPQSIAYAALADLPVQYGLYSSFIGTMLYVLLGTVKEVSIGPTSLMALLTLQTCHGLPVQYVTLLTFLSGCVVLAMGMLRLGFLVDLISPAVTSGFTSATAVLIVVAQLKGLLGLSFVAETVADNVWHIAAQWRHVRGPDCALGAACCAMLLLLRKLPSLPVSVKRVRVRRALWLLSIARNALVVCAAAALAYCTAHHDATRPHPLFLLSGRVEPGLPGVSWPPLSAPAADGNGTVSFPGMVRRLGGGVLMLPVVMVLANIAIAKAFSAGARVDATQEMLTLGLCNVAGSLVRAMPACGAFTRSAVSHASGVRSPLAGLYSGALALLALAFLTDYFYYIPRASLAAVLICAVVFMIDVSTVLLLWRESRAELCVLGGTFAVGVCASVELALLCGAAAGAARLLRALMRPKLTLRLHRCGSVGEAAVCRPGVALLYLSAEHAAARVVRAALAAAPRPMLVDCSQLQLVDHAAAQVLERVSGKLSASGVRLVVFNASRAARKRLEGRAGLDTRALRARTPRDALLAAPPARTQPPPPPQAQAQARGTEAEAEAGALLKDDAGA